MPLKAVKYVDDTGFEDYKVVKTMSLNYLDPIENSNKFYTAEIHECNGKYRVFTHYGRLGKKGTKDVRFTDDYGKAEREFESLIRKKTNNGYKVVELAQSNTGSEKGTQLVNKNNVTAMNLGKKKSNLEPLIEQLVRDLYFEAGKQLSQLVEGEFSSSNASPLGKLSVRQIERGRKVLHEIAYLLNMHTVLKPEHVYLLSKDYYSYIPKVFGHKIKVEDALILTQERLQEEMEILTFYEDAIRMGSVIYDNENLDKQYEALNTDIKVLDPTSKKYKQLVKYVNNTESKHHNVHLVVEKIYEINQKNAPIFDDSYGNIRELFHGSRSANIAAILSTNLKLPRQLQGVFITGAMFGPGIYFADQSTKSSQYACARFGGKVNKNDRAYLFVSDVALGKMHKVDAAHYFLEPPKGFDSVKGVEGHSLLHNEYIVYKENQQQIRYMIEFTTVSKRK